MKMLHLCVTFITLIVQVSGGAPGGLAAALPGTVKLLISHRILLDAPADQTEVFQPNPLTGVYQKMIQTVRWYGPPVEMVSGATLHRTLHVVSTLPKWPDHWKDINHNCGGDHQSPINIEKAKAKRDSHLGDLTFTGYNQAPSADCKLMNDGHSVLLSLSGDISISGAGLPNTYRTLQFHFHWGSPTKNGSEHTVDGKQFPLELHIVHINSKYSSVTEAKNDPEGLAVLGILITVGEADNPSYSPLVSAMKNVSLEGDFVLMTPTFPLENLLPAHEKLSSYYRYQGSLTTPDCSQAVIWTVFEYPVTISKTQYRILTDTAHFSAQGETLVKMKDNFRPPQPLKGRQVLASKDATASCSSGLCVPFLTLCMIRLTAWILLN